MMHHWACELRTFDINRNIVGEPTRHPFETYEQARQFANAAVARGGGVGAVVFALRRGDPREGSFVPGEVHDQ
jgi:hypothetical protein